MGCSLAQSGKRVFERLSANWSPGWCLGPLGMVGCLYIMGKGKQKIDPRKQRQRRERAAAKRAQMKRLKREAERMGLSGELIDEYINSKTGAQQKSPMLRSNNGGRLQSQRVKLRTGRR